MSKDVFPELFGPVIIVRVNKTTDKGCVISEVNYTNLNNLKGFNNPLKHYIFASAKQIFFSEKILFVEGQEDAGLILKYARDEGIELNFEIFECGSNGWNNFTGFLELSRALGIQKAAVLYDYDESDSPNPETKQTLKQNMEHNTNDYKEYKCFQLKTEDIRDKERNNKKGIFTEDGTIKKEHKPDFQLLINEINQYFK